MYDYLVDNLGIAHEDIILFGRSLGSSPSCYIAKERPQVGALILMSPFKSLREVAKDKVGQILSYLLAERYRNIELIEKVICPVLIIHGPTDSVIDIGHSIELKNRCGSSYCQLIKPENMDHNSFRIQDDIIQPIKNFFREVDIKTHRITESTANFQIAPVLY